MTFTFEQFIAESWLLIDLLLSVLLGFIIGLERKIRLKEAGIRTHTVVCFGSALMMLISMHAFGETADAGRVAAQIVSGVGFLGAGIIVYRQHEVRGLTTAAGVWATAGVGMACGAGMYLLAAGATAVLVLAQFLFHFGVFRNKRSYSVKIEFIQTDNENKKVKELFGTDRFNHLVIERKDGKVLYHATMTTDKEFSSTTLNKMIAENDFILSVERCDND